MDERIGKALDIFVPLFLALCVIGFIAVMGLLLYGVFNLDETDHYQQSLDRYQRFEQQCIEREFTQDECLLIWVGK